MPAATALPSRLQIAQWHHAGSTPAAIAALLQLPVRTVRHLLARWRQAPAAGLEAAYHRCGRPLDASRRPQREDCLALRRTYKGCGAGRLRLALRPAHPPFAVAPVRTLQRWLRQAGLSPLPAVVASTGDDRRAREPHEVGQVDAVERLTLKDGSGACWLRLIDECSGAILATEVFGLYDWSQVPASATQAALRRAFGRWGRPVALRADNGTPRGSSGGLPTALALWSAGLGVPVWRNAPRRPQQNAVVERSQGTSKRWAEPAACADLAELQRRLAEEDYLQREVYPAVDGHSRREAYPALLHSGRGYAPGWEEVDWGLHEALRFLGRYRVLRKVSQRGQVSLYHRLVEVGREHGGQPVYVQLDAATAEWVVSDLEGRALRRRPAPQLTREAVRGLSVPRP